MDFHVQPGDLVLTGEGLIVALRAFTPTELTKYNNEFSPPLTFTSLWWGYQIKSMPASGGIQLAFDPTTFFALYRSPVVVDNLDQVIVPPLPNPAV